MSKVLMTLEGEFPNDERVEKEAMSLIKNGYEVHLLCYSRKENKLFEEYKGIKVHRFRISTFVYKSSALSLQLPFYFFKWRKELIKVLKKENFSIVHIHDLPLISIITSLKGLFNFKTVLDLHENWPVLMKISKFTSKFPVKLFFSYQKWVNYEKKWIKKADRIIVVIDEAKNRIKNLRINPDLITVVQNTVDLSFFKSNFEQHSFNENTIIYSGGVNEHRGLQVVLHAITFLKKDNIIFKLHIIGGGSYMNDLKILARNLNIEDQLIDKGWMNFQQMMNEISKARILIIPHLKSEHTDATIPNKLFQYLYVSKPLIVSDCIPLERIVKKEQSGLVYHHNDPKQLYENLKTMHLNYNDYLKMASKNKQLVLDKYNWSVDETKLLNLYSYLK